MNILINQTLCTLGWVMTARSDTGVCAILLGDEPGPLKTDLRGRFAGAEFVQDSDTALAAQIVAAIDNPHRPAQLILDIRGTPFQRRVWEALQRIPAGQTRSYSDIASELGVPAAVRAVAGACAANALAVVIPCHRVVRRDGNLSGYRWGIERKRSLLQRERKLVIGSV